MYSFPLNYREKGAFIMPKLNPPHLETSLPAFYIDSSRILQIPFTFNRSVGIADISKIYVSIKTVQTNVEKYSGIFNVSTQADKDLVLSGIAKFTNISQDTFTPGQYYKVQLAFGDTSNPTIVGHYSSVGIMKCTNKPSVVIDNLNSNATNNSQYTYTGTYTNTDSNEKVYNYIFNIYNENNIVYETSGMLLHTNHDTTITSSSDSWSPTKSLAPGKLYTIEYKVITLNGLEAKSVSYSIQDNQLIALPAWFDGKLYATLYPDDAYIELKMYGNVLYGNFILSRSSSKDNFTTWHHISEFTISLENMAAQGIVLWKDFTIEQGVEYLYALQMKNSNNIYSTYMINENYKVLADFEDMFLYDGTKQLKIRFNPKVTSFKNTKLETKTDTIGNRFPYFFRNGSVSYKEFPISGLISMLTDENELFIDISSTLPQQRTKTVSPDVPNAAIRTQLTAENVKQERDFKLEVLEWLQNGELKLFKSPVEGNYIVRLLNISASPNDTLGRMIHTFTCTAYESAEMNFKNLQDYGFLNIDKTNIINGVHFTATTRVNDSPHNGIIIIGNRVKSQNDLVMKNLKLSNLTPYASVTFYTKNNPTSSTTKNVHTANEYGIIEIDSNKLYKSFDFDANDLISKNLAIIDFDYTYDLSKHNGWKTFNGYKNVVANTTPQYKTNLYSLIKDSAQLEADNTYDYLKYLNNNGNKQVGEAIYVYIHKRPNLTSAEVQNIGYQWSIKSFSKELQGIPAGEGRIFKDCGILSELKCGNGFDVDIIYFEKEVTS